MADIPNRDALLNDFARRSFRDIADHDYIAARLAYRSRLVDQFLWSGQQAVEKYLKAILLMNRVKAPKIGHNLQAALEKLSQLPFTVEFSDSSREFLVHLDHYGQYRYFETSPYVLENHLHLLDLLVWEIRRYCTPLDYSHRRYDGTMLNMLEPELGRIRALSKGPPHRLTIMDGELEKILGDRVHPARAALVYKNFRFGARHRKRLTMPTFSAAKNSPLLLHPEILDAVSEYVKISKNVYDAYKPLMDEALQKLGERQDERT